MHADLKAAASALADDSLTEATRESHTDLVASFFASRGILDGVEEV